jgi:hypothetical protein
MSRRRHLLMAWALATVAVAFLLPLQAAHAEVIRLRTGETIKGRPVADQSNENVLVVEDFLSGAVRRFEWNVVDPEDARRLKTDWGWESEAMEAVKGHRLVMRLVGGATEDVRGLVVKETETHYHILRGGKVLEVPKDQVEEKVEEDLDPLDIWTGEQLVQKFMEEIEKEGADLSNLDSREHWRIAEYAQQVGEFEVAQRHYKACADDDEFLRQAVAKQRLAAVEEILRNAAALDALRDIRQAVSLKSFQRARELLEVFPSAFPDAGEQIKSRFDKTKTLYNRKRAEHFQFEAKIRFPKLVMKEINAKVREPELGLSDVTSWTRRELPDAAFEQLTAMMQERDDSVTNAEARAFWDARKKSGWKTATYGAGTFIVDPPKLRPPKRKRSSGKQKRPKGGAAKFEVPKPPTRDSWWKDAAPAHRASWVMAFFAENSELFEVSDTFRFSVCTVCNGAGLESHRTQSGDLIKFLCRRCGGAQRDRRVQFR